jgi:outer membrane protein assembly factor BamB
MRPRTTRTGRNPNDRRAWLLRAAALLLLATWPAAAQFLPPPSGGGPIVNSPHFKAIPSSLDFGVVAIGTSKRLELTIQNNGVGILALQSWSASGPGFVVAQDPGLRNLDTGQSTVMYVDFTPTTAGAASGAVNFSTSAGDRAVPLSGQGEVQARVAVTPDGRFTFWDTVVGERSTTSVTIRNSGNGTLVVQSWAASGAGFFVTEAPSERHLGSGQSMSLEVVFQPRARGLVDGGVYFSTNAGEAAVPLSGRGVGPTFEVTPNSLDFGDQAVGIKSAGKSFTITNRGEGPLRLNGYSHSNMGYAYYEIGDFYISASLNPIPSGSSVTFEVTFKPTGAGAKSGSVTFHTNAIGPDGDGDYTVPVTGRGVAPAPPSPPQPPFTVTPTSLDFGKVRVGERVTKTLTIRNTLPPPSVLTNFYALATPSLPDTEFSAEAKALENGIPGGESRTMSVTFHPTRVGGYSATLSATFISVGGPITQVSLTATAIPTPPPGSPPAPPGSPPAPAPGGSDPGSAIPGGTTPGTPAPGGTNPGGTGPGTNPPAGTTPGRVSVDWPVFMQGPLQAGRAEVSLDPHSLTPWSVPLGSKPGGPPVVLGGIAYIGTEANGVFAIDTTARTQRWNRALGTAVRAAPAAGLDVIVVSAGGLLGLHPADGRILWQRPDIVPPPSVSPMRVGEVVYIGALGPGGFGQALYAVRAATGTNAWAAPAVLPAAALSTAAIDSERGLLFVAVGQPPAAEQPAVGPSAVVALRVSDGALAWPAPTVLLHPAPAALSVGRVATPSGPQAAVFLAAGATVTALNGATGAPLWSRSLPENSLQAPPVVSASAPGATLFVGGASGKVYALAANTGADAPGGLAAPVAPITGTLALAGSTLFLPTNAGLIALDTKTGTRLWTGEAVAASGVAVTDGGLYVGTADSRLAGWSGTGTPITPSPSPPPTGASVDLAVIQIQVQPVVYRTAGAVVRVVLTNRGSAETPYRLRLKVEPGSHLIREAEGRLAAGQTLAVALPWPAALMEEGARTLVAEVEVPGQTDSLPQDNRISQQVTVRL